MITLCMHHIEIDPIIVKHSGEVEESADLKSNISETFSICS